jgi:pseudouridine synthase
VNAVQVRLQKILSGAGVASRRAAEQFMREGRVSVNGQTVLDPGVKADPEQDDVRVDGRRVKAQQARYILLNKPKGYITTHNDPQRRPTVLALLGGVREYVYPVGRLDYDSEGLLLLTNDGDLAARLTHPRHEIARVYEARVRGIPDERSIARLSRGVVIDDRRTAPAEVRLVRETHEGKYDIGVLEMTIREGRNRQVRRMCESVGHPVFALRRIRIGPLSDPKLPTGAWRELTPREVASLQRVAGSLAAAHEPVEAPAQPERESRPPRQKRSPRPRERDSQRPRTRDARGTTSTSDSRNARAPRARDARGTTNASDSRNALDPRRPRTRDARGATNARDSRNALDPRRPRTRDARGTTNASDARKPRAPRDRDARTSGTSGLGQQPKHGRGPKSVGKPAHKRKVR